MPIHTLGSTRPDAKKDSTEEFSVGGKTSSTAVLRPHQPADPMNQLINQARSQQSSGTQADQDVGKVYIYRNGFIIGNGAFRDRKVPENEQFIQALQRGEAPQELQREAVAQWGNKVKTIGIQLVNKANEDYIPPPEKFSFAKSQGRSLGADSVSTGRGGTSLIGLAAREYKHSPDSPASNVQIVLKPRRRLVLKMNHTSTVGHLYQHVMFLSGTSTFQLFTGFPPQALTNLDLTLKDAKVIGASVEMR
jgi:UBX domain-containing protein 1